MESSLVMLALLVGTKYNNPLKYVPATKSVASTGLAKARRLAGRYKPSEGSVDNGK